MNRALAASVRPCDGAGKAMRSKNRFCEFELESSRTGWRWSILDRQNLQRPFADACPSNRQLRHACRHPSPSIPPAPTPSLSSVAMAVTNAPSSSLAMRVRRNGLRGRVCHFVMSYFLPSQELGPPALPAQPSIFTVLCCLFSIIYCYLPDPKTLSVLAVGAGALAEAAAHFPAGGAAYALLKSTLQVCRVE
jgi:hypothetical protein